jgi:KUP system potassium uptake protein
MPHPANAPGAPWKALALAALGVVFGDIGTSPLYALREAVKASGSTSQLSVYGVESLIFWALMVSVTRYAGILLRADNKGEGGILSLFALVQQALGRSNKLILLLGVGGAAMFFGDALITPAISVVSAVEGLSLASSSFDNWVLPLSTGILVALFILQQNGTGSVGLLFGPVMLLWFGVLMVLGIFPIIANPHILTALNPVYAFDFIFQHTAVAMPTLGAVFLAVTGGEALYADLGHFGRRPIQRAWLFLVFPALCINYLGQGALILAQPAAMENPFYLLAPQGLLLPMVILSTLATIIASQAVITGTFSLAHQAVAMGLMPRLQFLHTSVQQSGQIYCPKLNRWLMLGVIATVLGFGSSGAMASAYGVAVSMNMVATGLLLFVVIWQRWHRPLWQSLLIISPFVAMDIFFLSANLLKIREGGWMPLTVGAVLTLCMLTWVRGSRFLYQRTVMNLPPFDRWHKALNRKKLAHVPGTAVWLSSDTYHAPAALIHNIRHNDVLHAHNVILNIRTSDIPRVPPEQQIALVPVDNDFTRVQLTFGYMDVPDIPAAMVRAHMLGLPYTDGQPATYFLTHRSLKANGALGMPLWQDNLYIGLSKLAENATDFYKLPSDQVVEVGMQVQL